MNLNERIAIVETKINGMIKILWILVAATLTQLGVQIT